MYEDITILKKRTDDECFHMARNLSREDALGQAIARFGGE